MEICISNIDDGALCTIIPRIYDNTPESDKDLQHQVLRYAKVHLRRLLLLEDFKAVLGKVPEFSYQLLLQEVESRSSEELETKKRQRHLKGGDNSSIVSPWLEG